jgi:hypothetical protein
MDWSVSKVIRIETGAVSITTNDLKALLSLYEIRNSERVDQLVELARASRQSSWWSKYRGDVLPPFFQFLEYEEAASVVRAYDPLLLPGLSQTKEYADAVIRKLADPGTPESLMRTRLEIRLARQNLLEQPSPPTIMYIVDEAVIQRLVGERSIALGQLDRLISLANRPNVTIEVIPFNAGLHSGLLESFVILEFPDPEDSDVLFIESSRVFIVSHDEAGEISGYLEVFEHLRSISLGRAGTLSYLTNLAQRIAQ